MNEPTELVQRKIAVCGMAPSSRDEIPVGDETFEIWTLNVLPMQGLPRWDRHYEVHSIDWLRGRPGLVVPKGRPDLRGGITKESYIDWLGQDHGRPILVPQTDARIPSGVKYPLKEIVDQFGDWLPDGRPLIYFRSTVDWMLAHALFELIRDRQQAAESGKRFLGHISMLGVDMALFGDEYQHQRPSCEYWTGMAIGMGFSVYVPHRSDILKSGFVYGVDSYHPVATKMQQRQAELNERVQQAAAREQQARDEKLALRGALDDLQWVMQQRY